MKRFILITAVVTTAAAARILPLPAMLLEAAQSSSAPRTDGRLATAIQEGRRADALAMIKAGADVNQAQPDGTRPIHWAVYRVDHELVDALIAKKARVDVAN